MVQKKAPREFTPASAKSIVINIRAVFKISEVDVQNEIDNALDCLRRFGAAEIVERQAIAEGFDEASNILRSQSVE